MERPASLAALGILSIVFGGLTLILTAASLLYTYLVPQQQDLTRQIMQSSPVLRAWFVVATPLMIVLCLGEVVTGVGLFTSKPWARSWTIRYACVALFVALVTAIIQVGWLMPAAMQQVRQSLPAQQASGPVLKVAEIIAGLASLAGACVAFIYPTILLIFMNRRNVREYFGWLEVQEQSPAAPSDGTPPVS